MVKAQWKGEDGFIAFQSNSKKEWQQTDRPFVCDGVHGTFDVNNRSTAAATVFCSAYNEVLDKHVPVLISFLYSQTAEAYKKHFLLFFESLGYRNWSELLERFPGIIVDFSLSQESGFTLGDQ